MTIDIIDITLPEYADLSAVQLSMVRSAQAKKDKLTAEAAERKTQIFYLALGNNTARSSALKCEREEIDEKLNKDVTAVREDLIHQLAYESLGSEGNDKGPYRYPENPNYNLTYSQRFWLCARTIWALRATRTRACRRSPWTRSRGAISENTIRRCTICSLLTVSARLPVKNGKTRIKCGKISHIIGMKIKLNPLGKTKEERETCFPVTEREEVRSHDGTL